jgi:hypothetical protein
MANYETSKNLRLIKNISDTINIDAFIKKYPDNTLYLAQYLFTTILNNDINEQNKLKPSNEQYKNLLQFCKLYHKIFSVNLNSMNMYQWYNFVCTSYCNHINYNHESIYNNMYCDDYYKLDEIRSNDIQRRAKFFVNRIKHEKNIYILDGHGRTLTNIIYYLHKSNKLDGININVIDNDLLTHSFHENFFPQNVNSIFEDINNIKFLNSINIKNSIFYYNFCSFGDQFEQTLSRIIKYKIRAFITFSIRGRNMAGKRKINTIYRKAKEYNFQFFEFFSNTNHKHTNAMAHIFLSPKTTNNNVSKNIQK